MLPLFSFLSYAKLIYLKAEIQKIQHGAQPQAWKISKWSTIPPWQSRGVKELWQNTLHSWALPSCSSATRWEPTRKGSEEVTGEKPSLSEETKLLELSLLCKSVWFSGPWARTGASQTALTPPGQATKLKLLDFHQQDSNDAAVLPPRQRQQDCFWIFTSRTAPPQWAPSSGYPSLPFPSTIINISHTKQNYWAKRWRRYQSNTLPLNV